MQHRPDDTSSIREEEKPRIGPAIDTLVKYNMVNQSEGDSAKALIDGEGKAT
jgi:hypothetical protein